MHGTVLVASGAIGAGMFSLPIVSAGMWFSWAAIGLCAIWLLNLYATLLLLESNLRFPAGASFDTLVGSTLGKSWNFINNIAIAFVMYILLYAYFSASGSIVEQSYTAVLGSNNQIPQNQLGLLFGLLMAILVWLGTSLVTRICLVLLLAMILSFLMSTSGLLLQIQLPNLIEGGPLSLSMTPYIWAALPYFVASFACSGLVPSLVKYYGHQATIVKKSLINGTLISFVVYLSWLAACYGNISREEIAPIISAGGNMGDLSAALQLKANGSGLGKTLNLFSNFAIISSFLSIGLGLFDYIADRFKFKDSAVGRAKSAAITFIPPAAFSYFYPHGFIIAIGYAGLIVLFSFFIVPVVMAYTHRQNGEPLTYKVAGGVAVLGGILLASVLLACFKLLGTFNLLPIYP